MTALDHHAGPVTAGDAPRCQYVRPNRGGQRGEKRCALGEHSDGRHRDSAGSELGPWQIAGSDWDEVG